MRRDFFLNKMNKMDGKMCSKCNDVNEDLVRLSPTIYSKTRSETTVWNLPNGHMTLMKYGLVSIYRVNHVVRLCIKHTGP